MQESLDFDTESLYPVIHIIQESNWSTGS